MQGSVEAAVKNAIQEHAVADLLDWIRHHTQQAVCVATEALIPQKSSSPMCLVAPYRAIPRDYVSDTSLLRAMGFSVSQHGQLGAIPPPPFLSVSPFEHMRSRGAIPPPQKGYLSDTCAIPYENEAKWVRYPPLRYYLERVLRDMGGYLALGR